MKMTGAFLGNTPITILLICSANALGQGMQEGSLSAYADSTAWKANLIAEVAKSIPVPGGVVFEDIGDAYPLKSGILLFWGQYGRGKDWGLYSYKNGRTSLEFKAFEAFTTPDGVAKEFAYHDFKTRHGYPGLNKASEDFLYLYTGKGGLGVNSHLYSFDGYELKKVIGEGDKITVSGDRDVVVSGVRLERITNDNQAVIFFVSEKPKVRGWILHSKKGLKPLFNLGDEVPGRNDIKITDFYGPPVYEWLAKENNLFIFRDTLLAKLSVSHARFREIIVRITPNKTQVLDSSAALGIGSQLKIINAASGDNLVIRSDRLYQYKNGINTTIIEPNQTFTVDKKGDMTLVKGRPVYLVNSAVFLGNGKENLLLGIKRNDQNFEQCLCFFGNGKLTIVENIRPQLNGIVSPYPVVLRPSPDNQGAFVDYVFKDDKGIFFSIAPLVYTKKVKVEKGGMFFDGVTKTLTQASVLINDGDTFFDHSDIIAQPDANRLIVWRRVFLGNRALFELVK